MKQIKMPDMRTGNPEILIPGKWYARVPQISADDRSIRAYTTYYQQVYGWPPAQCRAAGAATLQAAFENGFIRQLKLSIQRWARLYAQRFPEARQPDGTLRGFDPDVVQNGFCPAENTGRKGKTFMKALMMEMWEDAEG